MKPAGGVSASSLKPVNTSDKEKRGSVSAASIPSPQEKMPDSEKLNKMLEPLMVRPASRTGRG